MQYRSSCHGSEVMNLTSIHEDEVPSLASLSGLRSRHCHELWHRSQRWLRSHVAVAVAQPAPTAPIQPLAWELPYAVVWP